MGRFFLVEGMRKFPASGGISSIPQVGKTLESSVAPEDFYCSRHQEKDGMGSG